VAAAPKRYLHEPWCLNCDREPAQPYTYANGLGGVGLGAACLAKGVRVLGPHYVKSPAEWRSVVLGSVCGVSGEKLDAVVARLMEHPDEGAWHAASVVFGRPDTCPCARCRPTGRRFA